VDDNLHQVLGEGNAPICFGSLLTAICQFVDEYPVVTVAEEHPRFPQRLEFVKTRVPSRAAARAASGKITAVAWSRLEDVEKRFGPQSSDLLFPVAPRLEDYFFQLMLAQVPAPGQPLQLEQGIKAGEPQRYYGLRRTRSRDGADLALRKVVSEAWTHVDGAWAQRWKEAGVLRSRNLELEKAELQPLVQRGEALRDVIHQQCCEVLERTKRMLEEHRKEGCSRREPEGIAVSAERGDSEDGGSRVEAGESIGDSRATQSEAATALLSSLKTVKSMEMGSAGKVEKGDVTLGGKAGEENSEKGLFTSSEFFAFVKKMEKAERNAEAERQKLPVEERQRRGREDQERQRREREDQERQRREREDQERQRREREDQERQRLEREDQERQRREREDQERQRREREDQERRNIMAVRRSMSAAQHSMRAARRAGPRRCGHDERTRESL
jgi:hypothetical protein